MLLGLPFHRVTEDEALEECLIALKSPDAQHIVTANLDFAAQAAKSPKLKLMITHAHRIFCDGQPLVWLSHLIHKPLPARVAGSDLTPKLLEACAQRGYRVFFLGSDPNCLAQVEAKLAKTLPSLKIVGTASPPYGEIDTWDNDAYVEQIQNSGADLLLVGMGFPKQDIWIDRYLQRIGSVKLAIGIGASLDFIAGKQRRAPKWMQRSGTEWFWRLASDPKRMARRYFNDFLCLLKMGSLQILCSHLPRVRDLKPQRLLNGLSFPDSHVVKAQAELVSPTGAFNSIIIDCSCVERVTPLLISRLVSWVRFAHSSGRACCISSPPKAMEKHLHRMQLHQCLPIFRHPTSVVSWADSRSQLDPENPPTLRAPTSLYHELSIVDFAHDLPHFENHCSTRGEEKHIDLSHVATLTVSAAIQMVRISRSRGYRLVGSTPVVRDLFQMLGLGDQLSDLLPVHPLESPVDTRTGGLPTGRIASEPESEVILAG